MFPLVVSLYITSTVQWVQIVPVSQLPICSLNEKLNIKFEFPLVVSLYITSTVQWDILIDIFLLKH